MTDIVDPKVVRNALPAPLPSDPPQIFDDKSTAMASWYQGFIDDLNLATGHTNQNAQATHEFADAVQLLWQQVQDGVITIQQAMAAIQAGPVVSVMGRSGAVVGLVESVLPSRDRTKLMADAPLGQWTSFQTQTGNGSDWPTSAGTAWWNVLTLGGSDTAGNSRKTQLAEQVFSQGGQNDIFIRSQHDATWSAWRRVLTDAAVIEGWRRASDSGGGNYNVYPVDASIQWIEPVSNANIWLAPPRSGGDQLTLRLVQRGSYSMVFASNNVKLPKGTSGLSVGLNECLTVTLIGEYGATNMWNLFVGARHTV